MSTPGDKIIKVGSLDVDLDKLAPLTMGDKAALAKLGVDFRNMRESTPEQDITLVHYILKKIDPSIKEDDVGSLPITLGQAIIAHLGTVSLEVDVPFGLRSTTSRGITGGPQQTASG